MTTITMRSFFEAIVNGTLAVKTAKGEVSLPALVTAEDGTVTFSEEMVEYAKGEIKKLDEKKAKRSSKPTRTQRENENIKVNILAQMKPNGVYVASDIAKANDISTQKVTALMKQLSADGLVTITDTKVKGKGMLKAYCLSEKAIEAMDSEETEVEETETDTEKTGAEMVEAMIEEIETEETEEESEEEIED